MAIEYKGNYKIMVCDCGRAGADMEAFDLPVVSLNCDGDCTDLNKVARYDKYLEEGGKPWKRRAEPMRKAI